MGVQLLPEVIPVAAGVLTFSIICLLFSVLLGWLAWVHHERCSYVAMLAYFTFLSTLASIIQQIHTIVDWRDIRIQQHNAAVANQGSVVVAVAGPSTGMDLALFFVQYYSYNVEALVALSWAMALVHSIYGWSDMAGLKKLVRRTSRAAKIVAVLLPVIIVGLLQLSTIQNNPLVFLLITNINLVLSPAFGALALILIMGKYIETKHLLLSWNVQYGKSTGSDSLSLSPTLDDSAMEERKSIYDNWLMIRFTIGFFCLSAFEVTQILFQLRSMRAIDNMGNSADLSAAKAKVDFLLFMPGCAASFVVFLVFGTTRTFRDTIVETFVPKSLRKPRPTEKFETPRTYRPSIGSGGGGTLGSKKIKVINSACPYPDPCLSPFLEEEDDMTFKLQDIKKPAAAHTHTHSRNSSWPDFSTFVLRMSRQSLARKKKKPQDDESPILNSPSPLSVSQVNDSPV